MGRRDFKKTPTTKKTHLTRFPTFRVVTTVEEEELMRVAGKGRASLNELGEKCGKAGGVVGSKFGLISPLLFTGNWEKVVFCRNKIRRASPPLFSPPNAGREKKSKSNLLRFLLFPISNFPPFFPRLFFIRGFSVSKTYYVFPQTLSFPIFSSKTCLIAFSLLPLLFEVQEWNKNWELRLLRKKTFFSSTAAGQYKSIVVGSYENGNKKRAKAQTQMLPFTKTEKKIATVCGGKNWGGAIKRYSKTCFFGPSRRPSSSHICSERKYAE